MKIPSVDLVFSGPFGLAEGIVWSEDTQVLLWVDIAGKTVFRGDPSTGRLERFEMPTEVGFCFPAATDRIIVGLNDGVALFDPGTAGFTPLSRPEPFPPGNRFNDAALDRSGQIWAGTMPLAGPGHSPEGALFCITGDGTATQRFGAFWIQNGLAFSPDGRTGYVSDSFAGAQMIWRFDLGSDGQPDGPLPFFDTRAIDGRPDGACVDADGCYWTAANDGWQIVRVAPNGKIDRRIPLPVAKPTKIAFGGPRFDTLFVTSMATGYASHTPPEAQPLAGAVLALNVGVAGLPDARFTIS
ncbi:L-arabinolactonase [Roseovarius sp. A-2]|uniref:SMP-30/gluconolactonase/LRE family protein n=1 Tax=Roseovarius sp. A-2 TaxID=1570360 RepID=UPI0009B566E2|nr:SMP-30/gluconolactonase/LRE family protein [Roseovarius sp. A-2]GAW34168.1 L-arabinolactonase [Roseovarius sp. A-2]